MSSKIEVLKAKVTAAGEAEKLKSKELMQSREKLSHLNRELEQARQRRGYSQSSREKYENEKKIRELEAQTWEYEETILKIQADLEALKVAQEEAQKTYDICKGGEIVSELRKEISNYNEVVSKLASSTEKILELYYSLPQRLRAAQGRDNILGVPTLNVLPDKIFSIPENANEEPRVLFHFRSWGAKLVQADEYLMNPADVAFHEPKNW